MLTQLLTLTTTHKFPSLGTASVRPLEQLVEPATRVRLPLGILIRQINAVGEHLPREVVDVVAQRTLKEVATGRAGKVVHTGPVEPAPAAWGPKVFVLVCGKLLLTDTTVCARFAPRLLHRLVTFAIRGKASKELLQGSVFNAAG